jgi:membrane protein required for colicin V production
MNWIDLIVIVVLAGSIILGFIQGFIMMFFSLLGTVIGILLASNVYTQVGNLFKFMPNTGTANILAFVLILVIVFIVAIIIGSTLKALLSAVHLGCIDKAAGGLLGLIVGVLLVGAVFAGFIKFFGEGPVTHSWIAKLLLDYFPFVLQLFPSSFKEIPGFFYQ